MARKKTERRRPLAMATRRRSTPSLSDRLGQIPAFVLKILLLLFIVPAIWVGVYRFVGPPITLLMIERLFQGQGIDHKWTPMSRIAPAMTRAVVASEDATFCDHEGFDFQAISAALKHNEARPGKVRGGSTISQQTAKNVFLWPQRSWVRKGAETWFTLLIETLWGKRRIMEVYLNTVEMGPGIYGVESASERYFGVAAANLSAAQASRLAAILPDPLKWKVERPGPYVQRRTGRIDARSVAVTRDGLAACVYRPSTMDGLIATVFNQTPSTGLPGARSKTADRAAKAQPAYQFPDPAPDYVTAPRAAPPPPSDADEPSVPPPNPGPQSPPSSQQGFSPRPK